MIKINEDVKMNDKARTAYLKQMRKVHGTPQMWDLQTNDMIFNETRMLAWAGLYLEKKRIPSEAQLNFRILELESHFKREKEINDLRKKLDDEAWALRTSFRKLVGDWREEDQYTDHFWSGRYMSH